MLSNDRIKLRAVEPEDVDYLFNAENDMSLWKVSETLIPFSRNTLKQYADSIHDLKSQGQYRFIIEDMISETPVGMVDLFEYNALNQRAGVGVVITDKMKRNSGYATDALTLLLKYAVDVLKLKQLYCSMHKSNNESIKLFERLSFKKVGERKDWFHTENGWESEILYQKLLR